MFKFIKQFKKNKELEAELINTKEQLKLATEFANNVFNHSDARLTIRALMTSELKVTDYDDMTYSQSVKYYRGVRDLVDNKTLQNEINRIIKNIKEEIFIEAPLEQIDKLRYSVNGLILLKENMEELPPPEDVE